MGLGVHTRQGFAQILDLLGIEFDDEPAATFQRNAHDVATAFLGYLERAIACPRLHCGHVRPLSSLTAWTAGRPAARINAYYPRSLAAR